MTGVVVAIEGVSALRDLEAIPASVKTAALRAVNRTADRTRTDSSRRIREQVAFSARYLDSRKDARLAVSKRATRDDLEAVITGRFRPTSLATFARNKTPNRKGGVSVEVAPGFARLMRRAFIIRLRAGVTELGNVGLALRLREGETVQNKRRMVPLSKGSNLYLLYGPSIDQLFRTVSEDAAPGASEFLEAEFLRLMDLD